MRKVVIYTDGACSGNPGPGGYAAILMCDGASKEISGGEPETTNNRMELRGPIEALKLLKEKCDVEIYSDSTYVVDSFNKGWIYSWKKNGWKRKDGPLKNPELIKELYELCNYHDVKWIKVKGHADNEYNNRCDELAVAAASSFKNKPDIVGNDAVRDTEYTGELTEKTVASETVFRGKVFNVEVSDVRLPDGNTAKREVVRHAGGAAIVAIDENKNILLVKQFRIATGEVLLEIPAGKLEKGENPAVCAARELEEETGYIPSDIRHVFTLYPTPGYCSEQLHIYFAKDLVRGNIHRDDGEFLHIVKLPYDIAYSMALNGQLNDAKTVAGILAVKDSL